MAVSDIADSIATDGWWQDYPDRAVAFFVVVDENGNVRDSGLTTNTKLGTDPNADALLESAKAALHALEF